MKLMKIMYYINILIIITETITIFLNGGSILWLVVMLSAIITQMLGVTTAMKRESRLNNIKQKG